MRIVATEARHQGVVTGRINLGKTSRPGRIVSMAQLAQIAFSGRGRMGFHGIFDMSRCRTVAHFTGDAAVQPLTVGRGDLVMAHGTSHAPGVLHLKRGDLIDRRRPVMTHLTEALGNQEIPGEQQSGNHQGKKNGQSSYLLVHYYLAASVTSLTE